MADGSPPGEAVPGEEVPVPSASSDLDPDATLKKFPKLPAHALEGDPSSPGLLSTCDTGGFDLSPAGTVRGQFLEELRRRGRNIATGWRKFLDPQHRGFLTRNDFCTACRRWYLSASVREAWADLDRDQNGVLTLGELDWATGELLGRFLWLLRAKYGSVELGAQSFGLIGSKRLLRDEFLEQVDAVELGSVAEGEAIFEMLCNDHYSARPGVCMKDFDWLDAIGSRLPLPTVTRVPPGMASDGLRADLLDASSSADEQSDAGDGRSKAGDHVFRRLYAEGLARHEQRREYLASLEPVPPQVSPEDAQTAKAACERLYDDWRALQWRRLARAEERHETVCPTPHRRYEAERSATWARLLQTRSAPAPEPDAELQYMAQATALAASSGVPIAAHLAATRLYDEGMRRLDRQHAREKEAAAAFEEELRQHQESGVGGSRAAGRRVDAARVRALYEEHRTRREKREQQIAEHEEKERQRLLEEAAAAHPTAVALPKTEAALMESCMRLHLEHVYRQAQREEMRRVKEEVEMVRIQEASIHKSPPHDGRVFIRLYRNTREEPEPPDEDEISRELEMPDAIVEAAQRTESRPRGARRGAMMLSREIELDPYEHFVREMAHDGTVRSLRDKFLARRGIVLPPPPAAEQSPPGSVPLASPSVSSPKAGTPHFGAGAAGASPALPSRGKGKLTSSESEAARSARRVSMQLAPEPEDKPPRSALVLNFHNLDGSRLMLKEEQDSMAALEMTVKRAVAQEAGPGTRPRDVSVTVIPKWREVECRVEVGNLRGIPPKVLHDKLQASPALCPAILSGVLAVDLLRALAKGPMTVTSTATSGQPVKQNPVVDLKEQQAERLHQLQQQIEQLKQLPPEQPVVQQPTKRERQCAVDVMKYPEEVRWRILEAGWQQRRCTKKILTMNALLRSPPFMSPSLKSFR